MISLLLTNPVLFVFSVVALLVAISLHEFAHAFVAVRLGDPTPEVDGRVTLNPKAHLDLYGTLLLFLVGFGWGKPVRFDPYNLEHPRRDSALISIAGPLTNFAIAIISSIVLRLVLVSNITSVSTVAFLVLSPMISLNMLLGLFNLIPIAPLDGFKIVGGILNEAQAIEWYKLERYGVFFLLMLLIPFGSRSMLDTILTPVLRFCYTLLVPFPPTGIL